MLKPLDNKEISELKQLCTDIDILLRSNMPTEALKLLKLQKALVVHDNDLSTVYYLLQIDAMEREDGIPAIFTKVNNIADAVLRYTYLKFLLRRLEYNMPEAEYDFAECHKLMNYSPVEIQQIAGLSCITPNIVTAKAEEILKNEC